MPECLACEQENGDPVVQCDKYDEWTHFACAKLTQEQIRNIVNFFCKNCEYEDCIIRWRRKRATDEQKAIKAREYYDVEDIIDHRQVGSKREFFIRWKSDSETPSEPECTWEPEEHLDGAIDLLQRYCRKAGIAISTIPGLLGADLQSSQQLNRSNWVTIDEILDHFERMRKKLKLTTDIQASKWNGFGQQDAIYFLEHDFHCYVVLHCHKRQLAYITDGSNTYRSSWRTAEEMRSLLSIRLISLAFEQQNHVDYCGRSAILIAVEMVRMYTRGIKYIPIRCYEGLRLNLVKQLHKQRSQLSTLPRLGDRRKQLKCSFCSKTYKSDERRNLSLHMTRCHSQGTLPLVYIANGFFFLLIFAELELKNKNIYVSNPTSQLFSRYQACKK